MNRTLFASPTSPIWPLTRPLPPTTCRYEAKPRTTRVLAAARASAEPIAFKCCATKASMSIFSPPNSGAASEFMKKTKTKETHKRWANRIFFSLERNTNSQTSQYETPEAYTSSPIDSKPIQSAGGGLQWRGGPTRALTHHQNRITFLLPLGSERDRKTPCSPLVAFPISSPS